MVVPRMFRTPVQGRAIARRLSRNTRRAPSGGPPNDGCKTRGGTHASQITSSSARVEPSRIVPTIVPIKCRYVRRIRYRTMKVEHEACAALQGDPRRRVACAGHGWPRSVAARCAAAPLSIIPWLRRGIVGRKNHDVCRRMLVPQTPCLPHKHCGRFGQKDQHPDRYQASCAIGRTRIFWSSFQLSVAFEESNPARRFKPLALGRALRTAATCLPAPATQSAPAAEQS